MNDTIISPNAALIETYRANRKITDPEFFKLVNNKFKFNMYLLTTLPYGIYCRT